MSIELNERKRGRSGGFWVVSICAAVALNFALFSPLLPLYPSAATYSAYPDLLEFIWTSWRLESFLSGDERLYSTKRVFAPHGASLLLHTLAESVLLPATYFLRELSPEWRINLVSCFVSILNVIASVSLFRAVGAASIASLLLGLLFSFSPFVIGHLFVGHLNFLILFPLLEAVRGVYKLLNIHGRGSKLRASDYFRYLLAVGLLPFSNLYYLYYFALLASLLALREILTKSSSEDCAEGHKSGWRHYRAFTYRGVLIRLALLTGFALAPAVPHLYEVADLALSKTYSPDHSPRDFSADLFYYLVPSEWQRFSFVANRETLFGPPVIHYGESSLFVPSSLMLLVLGVFIFGIWERRNNFFFLGLSLLFLILSMGPQITVLGSQVGTNPIYAMCRYALPLFPSVPIRFGGVAFLCILLFVAESWSRMSNRIQKFLVPVMLCSALVEVAPIPLPVVHLEVPENLIEKVWKDSEIRILLDLPVVVQEAMLRQTRHHKDIIGGFLSRRPRRGEHMLRRNKFIKMMHGEKLISLEEAKSDWCQLHADAVLLHSSELIGAFKSTVELLDFEVVGEERGLVVLKRPHEDCKVK